MLKRCFALLLVLSMSLGMAALPAQARAQSDTPEGVWCYGSDSFPLDGGEPIHSSGWDSFLPDGSNYAEGHLTGTNLTLYRRLKADCAKIANGTETVSVFDYGDVGGMGITYANGKLYGIDTGMILFALLTDCPYELFWFNKVKGWRYEYLQSGGTVTNIRFVMPVIQAYALDGPEPGTAYTNQSDAAKIRAANSALQNAQAVVRQNSGKSDYEKLAAYKDYICSQVSYNRTAADTKDYPYGDPWQMVYVFDNNPSTNVVCEGYAKAFKYLCDLSSFSSNIECYLANGTADGGDHMWNLVRVDGRSYLVDVTFLDTGGQSSDWFLAGAPNATGDGFTTPARSVSYRYRNEMKSLFGSGLLTLAPTGLSAPTPTPTPTPTQSGLKTDFENLLVHEIAPSGYSFDDQEYTLGDKPADLSVLVLGSARCGITMGELKTIQKVIADLGVEDARIYLMEVKLEGADGVKYVREHVQRNPSYVHVAAFPSGINQYYNAFWDVTRACDGQDTRSATMPSVVVLDKNSWPFYYASRATFDEDEFRAALEYYAGEPFRDVKAGAFYEKAVNWAVSGKITKGTGDSKFSPTQTCTHAQIITFLWRAMGEPKSSTYGPPSGAELPRSHFAYDALCWAASKGMLPNLDSAGTVDEPCTRAQAMFYIWSAFNRPSGGSASFSDVPSYMFYADAVSWAVDLGVTNGTGSGKFSPDTVCDRGTIVTFLHRAFVEEVRVK